MFAPETYLGALGLFALAIAWSEYLDRSATDDPFSDGAYGDDPFISPDNLETLFHANSNNHGRQEDHAA